jgi:hypothetical protein
MMNQNLGNASFQRISGKPSPSAGDAMERFQTSMNFGFHAWQDGIGYDLDALQEMNQQELATIEDLLIKRWDEDWRDVEALAALGTEAAVQALLQSLHSGGIEIKIYALLFLKMLNVVDCIDDTLEEILPRVTIGSGMGLALYLAKLYPSERIREKILWCSLNGNDNIRIHCAAMSLYLYGLTSETFDTNFKIVYEFKEPDREKRFASFSNLCRMIGKDNW